MTTIWRAKSGNCLPRVKQVHPFSTNRPGNSPRNPSMKLQSSPGKCLGPTGWEHSSEQVGWEPYLRAEDTRLGRKVAIKISREEYSDRFQREARAIAALNHPNICTIYDVGPDYFVMELVEGQTLKQRLSQCSLTLEQVCRFGRQIADALAAAHARGIVHRDLKPANIMLAENGVKVLDFGLAQTG